MDPSHVHLMQQYILGSAGHTQPQYGASSVRCCTQQRPPGSTDGIGSAGQRYDVTRYNGSFS
jgi:hypothetical protein